MRRWDVGFKTQRDARHAVPAGTLHWVLRKGAQGLARSAAGQAYAAKHACGQAFGRDLSTVFPAHFASGQVLLFVLQQLLASTRLHSRVLGSCGCWRGDVRVCLPALTCCERLAARARAASQTPHVRTLCRKRRPAARFSSILPGWDQCLGLTEQKARPRARE